MAAKNLGHLSAKPEELFVVRGDPEHALCAPPRARNEKKFREMIESIKFFGVVSAVKCKHITYKGEERLAIIFGRDRREAAETAFRELREAGLPFPSERPGSVGEIPYILADHLSDEKCRAEIQIENSIRRGEEPLANRIEMTKRNLAEQEMAHKARHPGVPFDRKTAERKACVAEGIDPKTLERWFALDQLPPATQALFFGENPLLIESVDRFLITDTEHHEVLAEKIIEATDEGTLDSMDMRRRTRAINEAAADIPTVAPRARGGSRGPAKTGAKVPHGPKLTAGLTAVEAKRIELDTSLKSLRARKSRMSWEEYSDGLVQVQKDTNGLLQDALLFMTGQSVEWLAPIVAAKTKKKQEPPRVAKAKVAKPPKQTKEEKEAARAEAKAEKKRKAEAEKEEEAYANAEKRQREGKGDLRNKQGQAAYQRHILDVLRSRPSSWTVAEIVKIVKGTPKAASAYLALLEKSGHVDHEGRGKNVLWTALVVGDDVMEERLALLAEGSDEEGDVSGDADSDDQLALIND